MPYRDAVPVISTADVMETVNYYNRVLGFQTHFLFGEPPVYAGLERDGVLLYVTRDVAFASAIKSAELHPEVFIWVNGIDAVYAEHKKRGAIVVEEIADRAWDARQYVLADPNGYWLKIAQPTDELVSA